MFLIASYRDGELAEKKRYGKQGFPTHVIPVDVASRRSSVVGRAVTVIDLIIDGLRLERGKIYPT